LNHALRLIRRLGGRGMTTVCRRRGVRWELDLDEGIDLSIYLFGAYELRSLRAYAPLIRPGATVFDISAHIGARTLHFARLAARTLHFARLAALTRRLTGLRHVDPVASRQPFRPAA
jgi:hypothetical protein